MQVYVVCLAGRHVFYGKKMFPSPRLLFPPTPCESELYIKLRTSKRSFTIAHERRTFHSRTTSYQRIPIYITETGSSLLYVHIYTFDYCVRSRSVRSRQRCVLGTVSRPYTSPIVAHTQLQISRIDFHSQSSHLACMRHTCVRRI